MKDTNMRDYIKNLHKKYEIKQIKLDTSLPVQFNSLDNIYLAVSTVYNAPNFYVYTMVNRYEWLGYNLGPRVNVAEFTNQHDADLYHDYIEKIMERQLRYKMGCFQRCCNIENAKDFYGKILDMQMGIKTLEKQK